MSFPLIMPARRLSKAALDDLIRESKASEIKGSEYGELLYTDKKTKYLLETADKCEILKLHSLEVDVGMVEATDNDPDACEYLTDFLKMAKAA
ncbi:hypothetical protein COL940_006384 [Colletotrichum noveboracense]|nr:hypothetical protein CBS470a_011528 [Colletotrichum nupharicola]KAJ0280132.1 hypothetical protein COL940_006384 [Colletotrichum noveboracense]